MTGAPNPTILVGLPWQLAEPILQAASIPYRVFFGKNYESRNRVASEGWYVARVRTGDDMIWEIVVYRPMIASAFGKTTEVEYASIFKTIQA